MELKKKKTFSDERTIDVSDEYGVDYLAEELKTTKSKLLAAVAEVGDSFADVKRHLKK